MDGDYFGISGGAPHILSGGVSGIGGHYIHSSINDKFACFDSVTGIDIACRSNSLNFTPACLFSILNTINPIVAKIV